MFPYKHRYLWHPVCQATSASPSCREAFTDSFWPMRCARSSACADGSSKVTWLWLSKPWKPLANIKAGKWTNSSTPWLAVGYAPWPHVNQTAPRRESSCCRCDPVFAILDLSESTCEVVAPAAVTFPFPIVVEACRPFSVACNWWGLLAL